MIYTCYFSGLGDRSGRAVSVTLQQPPRFRLPVAEELAPPFGMYWKFLRGRMSVARFSQIYSMTSTTRRQTIWLKMTLITRI